MSDYTTVVVIWGPNDELPLVLNPKKERPRFWKFAGGRRRGGETPPQTAVREVEEELGLRLCLQHLHYRFFEKRRNHTLHLFEIRVKNLNGLKKRGDEGEETAVFSLEEIDWRKDFFPSHRAFMVKLGHLT